MNRRTPLVVVASLLGSLGIYCSGTVVEGGGHGGPVGEANADPAASGACCTAAPQFTKLAEGDLQVASASESEETARVGADVDVSAYRQVSVLQNFDGACSNYPQVQFRADGASSTWGAGLSPTAGIPVPVLAPIMHVGLGVRGKVGCAATGHYVVLGLK